MRFPRSAGILLHPTSLPGDFGIGDLGPEAYKFVDTLVKAGQSHWQILPLGPTGYGDSPYSSFSAFAGNTLLISPEKLVTDELITTADTDERPKFQAERIDYQAVSEWKARLLAKSFERFSAQRSTNFRSEFDRFCESARAWLDDYALYRALKRTQNNSPWYEWPEKFKLRDERTITIAREQLSDLIDEQRLYQFLIFRQWLELKRYANDAEIKIIGDIPIFVALDSADVWCEQLQFKLNPDGSARVVAGVPPDYFSKTGQLWGNPIYNWDAMRRDGFRWWKARFRHMLKLVDVVRVDHFRGFSAAWEVPGGDETAEHGEWVNVPGHELFAGLKREFGEVPIMAEDLGVMTPDVEDLRDDFGFPGMRILQYAFGGDAKNRDLPHTYIPNTVAYTGTHDNDTIVGWWNGMTSDQKVSSRLSPTQEHCLNYLGTDDVADINWKLVRLLYSSVADVVIIPLQDVLGLGNEARMNTPATTGRNWQWRFERGATTDHMVAQLKELAELYGRK